MIRIDTRSHQVTENHLQLRIIFAAVDKLFEEDTDKARMFNVDLPHYQELRANISSNEILMPRGYTRERGVLVLKICSILISRYSSGVERAGAVDSIRKYLQSDNDLREYLSGL